MKQETLNLGVIGNCSVAALVNEEASIEWFCLPHFDSDPVLSRLVNGPIADNRPGYFDIHIDGLQLSEQQYTDKTAILVTRQKNDKGDEIEITDFCPVMANGDLPKAIVRIVRAVSGTPAIHCTIQPTFEYGAVIPVPVEINASTIGFEGGKTKLRLTTNADTKAVTAKTPLTLSAPLFFVLGEENSIDSLEKAEQALKDTTGYWLNWIKGLSIPKQYADETTRAAIALKLCTHKELGGMVAAHTTSIPEYDDCKFRHWDYRYSWVRDNYFTVNALTLLGDKECLLIYSKWLRKILEFCRQNAMYPAAFRVSGSHDAEEEIVETLSGYRGQGMVRVGNEAYKQQQNDFFAGAILSLLPFFTDARFKGETCPVPVEWLEDMAAKAYEKATLPDAGLWEFRTKEQVFTYSAVNCWNACHSMHLIYQSTGNAAKSAEWKDKADSLKAVITEKAWNPKVESYTNAFGSDHADGSLFLLRELGFIEKDDPRLKKTINFLEGALRDGVFVYRHNHDDDFTSNAGHPVNSFTSCTLWMLMAMADAGRDEEATKIFDEFMKLRSKQGMFSEHMDPKTGALWANYPQTYAMAGIVTFALKINDLAKNG